MLTQYQRQMIDDQVINITEDETSKYRISEIIKYLITNFMRKWDQATIAAGLDLNDPVVLELYKDVAADRTQFLVDYIAKKKAAKKAAEGI